MKRLTLIRHAKSDWSSGAASDHERPLNDRGRRDAPEMGRRLLARGLGFDQVIASDAQRARETITAIRLAMGEQAGRLRIEPLLYLARAEAMLALIREQDRGIEDLALVGHNPGMTELAQMLSAKIDDLPTCAVVSFEFANLRSWEEIGELKPDRVMVDLPKRKWEG